MAEKHDKGHALALTLTYRNDIDGNAPLGARAFCYDHFVIFKKRLAEAYYRKYEKRQEISWIACAENGSKKGRAHFHVVLFSKQPLEKLGAWSSKRAPVQFETEKRIDWQYWEHGFVYAQRPDAKGMAYCLVYGLKDQFGAAKSRGHKRETKSENFAAGIFRMSKIPPIGQEYLENQIKEWETQERLPTSLNIKVPDYSGYWYLSGKFRELALHACYKIASDYFAKHNKEIPQLTTLAASLNEKDLELLNGTEQQEPETAQEYADAISAAQRTKRGVLASREIVRQCGNYAPCNACQFGLERSAFEVKETSLYREFLAGREPSEQRFKDWQLDYRRTHKKPSGFCSGASEQGVRAAFAAYRTGGLN